METTPQPARSAHFDSVAPDDEVGPLVEEPRAKRDHSRDASQVGLAAESIEELADDLLHLLQRVREVSDGQTSLRAQVEASLSRLEQVQRQQAAELYKLRRDLLEDRRAQANRSAFDAVHPAIDQIELIQAALLKSDRDAARHISALLSALRMVLRGLGFVPFSAEVGDPFDPAHMECVEYAEGEQGVVLAVLRPGYRAEGVVVRPCGVAIADPATVVLDPTPGSGVQAAEDKAESARVGTESNRIEIEDDA